jgi:hypothetical protein
LEEEEEWLPSANANATKRRGRATTYSAIVKEGYGTTTTKKTTTKKKEDGSGEEEDDDLLGGAEEEAKRRRAEDQLQTS